eukprot:3288641-Pyramimonas_sp.AAC.1
MEGGPFSNCDSSSSAAHICLQNLQGFHGWRAVPFSTCGSRLSAAHIRSNMLLGLHGWRAAPFQ